MDKALRIVDRLRQGQLVDVYDGRGSLFTRAEVIGHLVDGEISVKTVRLCCTIGAHVDRVPAHVMRVPAGQCVRVFPDAYEQGLRIINRLNTRVAREVRS